MPGTTTCSLSTNTDTLNHMEQASTLRTSTKHICTSCQISFQNGQSQRQHMKQPWHIYNIKRRIASLPPIPLHIFESKVKKPAVAKEICTSQTDSNSSSSSSSEDEDKDEQTSLATPFHCLFCSQTFPDNEQGLSQNISHMQSFHNFFIPSSDLVEDMRTFLKYLATEIRTWHECLYCGATKPSTAIIQCHMRDKGHCMLNFDREPELREFWEVGAWEVDSVLERGHTTNVSETEMRFASGKVVGSRNLRASCMTRKTGGDRAIRALEMRGVPASSGEAGLPPLPVELRTGTGRPIARREEMGIVGISTQQRQALVLAEKKAQRSEAVARQAREWVYAKGANSQKYDQLDNQMKFGKQNHKLLPR